MEQPELNENEEIRDILGYEGMYMISNHGRIWSCEREKETTDRWGPCVKSLKAKWLKPRLDSYGYNHVVLRKDNECKPMSIHRLVATAFIPNSLNLPEVNHKDGNKLNNHFLNLEWVTQQQNKNHAMETRLHSPNRTSEYHGVYWNKARKKWQVQIVIKGMNYYIGLFNNELDAAQAWDNYLNEHNITDRSINFLTFP